MSQQHTSPWELLTSLRTLCSLFLSYITLSAKICERVFLLLHPLPFLLFFSFSLVKKRSYPERGVARTNFFPQDTICNPRDKVSKSLSKTTRATRIRIQHSNSVWALVSVCDSRAIRCTKSDPWLSRNYYTHVSTLGDRVLCLRAQEKGKKKR